MTGRAIVDTNVVSYIFKGDSRALLYQKHLDQSQTYVSFATVAELYRWAVGKKWGSKRIDLLREDLKKYVVLPFDDDLAWHWARVMSIKGVPMEPGDAWIAAAALRYGLPLVTHNRRDFQAIPGLQIVTES